MDKGILQDVGGSGEPLSQLMEGSGKLCATEEGNTLTNTWLGLMM
jgi:hypothetical protein